jgi:ubiquinone/menaquinone biosynthesis C-methylase UbiE
MFKTRSKKLERIDTGDYTPEEYAVFMREIAFINKYLGDQRALKKTLLKDVTREWQKPDRKGGLLDPFSVLDVGCGSGELLRYVAEFARRNGKNAHLVGLDLNELSTSVTASESREFPEISAIRGNAFHLPFADGAFDYAISSLFFHHLTDEQIPKALNEMSRVARRGIYVIDLHRHPMAYVLYKLFCFVFRISPLVTQDGSLSILKGFRREELLNFGEGLNKPNIDLNRSAPFRLVLTVATRQALKR